ncbi:hypothetical protein F5Y03DRAFT_363592 [Xylaria venustula]|nr:hypothetical protein F5Y03DRAFT_363592 [Xylaria venustula]
MQFQLPGPISLLANTDLPLQNDVGTSCTLASGLTSKALVPPTDTETCKFCHKTARYLWNHDDTTLKACSISGCNSRFYRCAEFRAHLDTPHLPHHRAIWDDAVLLCAECNETFEHRTKLLEHAKDAKHSPYKCFCGVKFARCDVLIRHLKSFTKESAKYPCTFCRRHRGKQAFRRRDHLVQHLQGYHKMEPEEINEISPPVTRVKSHQILSCPHADCEAYRDDAFRTLGWSDQLEGRPFQKQSDYNRHMRDVHQESTFECPVGSCDRVGAKGYMHEKDFIKHLADKHPEAPSYSYAPPSLRGTAVGNAVRSSAPLPPFRTMREESTVVAA